MGKVVNLPRRSETRPAVPFDPARRFFWADARWAAHQAAFLERTLKEQNQACKEHMREEKRLRMAALGHALAGEYHGLIGLGVAEEEARRLAQEAVFQLPTEDMRFRVEVVPVEEK